MTNEVELLKKQLDEATEMYIQLGKASSKEIVILNRALELACQELSNAKEMLYSVDQEENLLEDRIEYYIAEARGEVEDDKQGN